MARENPALIFTSLNHFIDMEWMLYAFELTRKDGAVGIDNQTGKDYALNLHSNIADLLGRIKTGTYRAPAVRRVYIPKSDGKMRGLGVPTFEDKIAQRAILMLLESIYEQDFMSCSYGFRVGKSAHQALQSLRNHIMDDGVKWVIDADISKFFDDLSHEKLREILDERVVDGVVRRMIDKWLKAGFLESGEIHYMSKGTPQGGVISPCLANIYLHAVLDKWFEKMVKPVLKKKAYLVRFCDDFVLLFADHSDMSRVFKVLNKRLNKFDLNVHETKTKIVDFRFTRWRQRVDDKYTTAFSFLGFTHVWGKSLKGKNIVLQITAKDRLSRAIKSIYDFCKTHRHYPVEFQHKRLCQKMKGHFAYFGITGNHRKLRLMAHQVERIWRKWLSRRKRGSQIKWIDFKNKILNRFPLPDAKIMHKYTVQ